MVRKYVILNRYLDVLKYTFYLVTFKVYGQVVNRLNSLMFRGGINMRVIVVSESLIIRKGIVEILS